MKHFLLLLTLLGSFILNSQNVQVDSQTYSAQDLVESILINSNCVPNAVFTSVSGGNFNNTDQSYGYFDASGTSFPFENGVVLSTGRLQNVEGPNTTLSDDDAPNWGGDNDLESILNESNTFNATILEFEFSTIADQINFRYIFASEEYQENNANTCQYSDAFAFLIRPINQQQYTNIAVIPNTQTPVKVTTVHPEIPNGCAAQNEAYFGSWNNASAPINFNGQTAVLTATANVIPNQMYHVKLVIADEENYRYDSAVFLEAGSFNVGKDLGESRLFANNNPLCENETITLDATMPGNNSYKWFKDDVEIIGVTTERYVVTKAGKYNVEVTLENNCIAYGEITIEYTQDPTINPQTIVECDEDQDGLTTYNLFDIEQEITNVDPNYNISNFFTTQNNAVQNTNEILNPTVYQNSVPSEIVFARIENQYGCFSVIETTLDISNNSLTVQSFNVCDEGLNDGFTIFDLNALRNQIESNVPPNTTISFYANIDDAFNDLNGLNGDYINTIPYTETLYVKVNSTNQCYALTTVDLNVLFTPELQPNESTYYCLNSYPEFITLDAGIINDSPINYTYEWFFNNSLLNETSSTITINETGTYTVTATYTNGCFASRDISVLPTNVATITNIAVQEASINNSITVNISGEGDYEFALDNQPYQNSNMFSNVMAGFHTVYVRDINGCGVVQQLISVLGFPKFFTPNGDSYKDTWKPLGVNAQFNAGLEVKIFDRFGKLLKIVNPMGDGWNGTFNGYLLPSDDYWFVVSFPDGKEYRGHFALVR